jgi:hypothetical protein
MITTTLLFISYLLWKIANRPPPPTGFQTPSGSTMKKPIKITIRKPPTNKEILMNILVTIGICASILTFLYKGIQ